MPAPTSSSGTSRSASGPSARQPLPLSLADLAVDGRDLRDTLGIPEGPVIGRILDRLLQDVIDDPSLDRRHDPAHAGQPHP